MRKEALKYLGCCRCNSELKAEKTKIWKGDIRSGKLVCKECGLIFPIAVGRPILMTSESVSRWKSPVDEALGIEGPGTFDQSIERLVSIGINNALKQAKAVRGVQDHSVLNKMESIGEIPKAVIGKVKYRRSGKWFRHGNRMERLMAFSWNSGDKNDSFNIFMKEIADTRPKVLLDIASGEGFGVSHQVFHNSGMEQTLAVERDIKCLGNIQYRFKYLGRNRTSEAVGGDVRWLPVRTETIDTAMMLAALPEIHGISAVLEEAYRVLITGGYYIIMVTELPFTSRLISLQEFKKFAEGADLYSGYEKFQSDAEKLGFKIENSERFKEKSGKFRRLISLRK